MSAEVSRDQSKYPSIHELARGKKKPISLHRKTWARLLRVEEALSPPCSSLIEVLADRYQKDPSLNTLSGELDVQYEVVCKLFDLCGIPRLTQVEAIKKRWQDPAFRERLVDGIRETWQNPVIKARRAEAGRRTLAELKQKPGYRDLLSKAMRKKWQDPEFRERNAPLVASRLTKIITDPTIKARQLEGTRRMLGERWQDLEFRRRVNKGMKSMWQDAGFRQRQSDATRRVWQDPEFRKRIAAEGVRARFDPSMADRYHLPTIHGFRGDIGFYAQSMWEANFARILLHLGVQFYTREAFHLKVPEKYQNVLKMEETVLQIDFVVEDKRRNLILYEIMAHPTEEPIGWCKLQMLKEQYPGLRIRVVTEKYYKRLMRRFKERINSDPKLCGWETYEDNLRTNPNKYRGTN